MTDDEAPLSKRERQKQRKQAKRQAEQAARRRQRTRKLLATGVVVAVVVAGLGAGGFVWQQSRAERGDMLAGDAQAAEAGCSAVEQFEAPANTNHIPQGQFAQLPPDELYDHRPHTAGRHTNNVVQTGVWDKAIDERFTGHNLEHGYVVAFWAPDAPEDDVEALQRAAQGAIDGGQQKLVAAQWMGDEPMDDDAQVAFVAWRHRMLCDAFDADVFTAFVDEHHDSFDVPEPGGDPHLDVGIVPDSYEADELLLPPLDDNQQLIQAAG